MLRGIQPNAGIEAAYRKKLTTLVDQMHRSILYFVKAAYKQNEPKVAALAMDRSPASILRAVIKKLTARWRKRFDDAAEKMAAYFAQSVERRSTANLKQILKDAGFSIPFDMTKAALDIIDASVAENVSLIKSIPAQYLNSVEVIVMQAVQVGGDLGPLTKELEHQYGVTKRHAALIARDQSSKATAAITRARQLEAGLTQAQWCHSGGGKHPRPTHVKAGRDKVIYNVAEGWLDPAIDKKIWPGTEVYCRCFAKPVLHGFS